FRSSVCFADADAQIMHLSSDLRQNDLTTCTVGSSQLVTVHHTPSAQFAPFDDYALTRLRFLDSYASQKSVIQGDSISIDALVGTSRFNSDPDSVLIATAHSDARITFDIAAGQQSPCSYQQQSFLRVSGLH